MSARLKGYPTGAVHLQLMAIREAVSVEAQGRPPWRAGRSCNGESLRPHATAAACAHSGD